MFGKIKNKIKNLFVKRVSERPAKTFLWIALEKDMKKFSKGKEIGLDAACGPMINRELFLTQKYIGLDMSEEYLRQGLDKYPRTEMVISKIEDMSNISADIVLCVQTININNFFDTDNTVKVISNLIATTKNNGCLMFNIGDVNDGLNRFSKEIDALLKANFEKVKKRKYGFLRYYKTNLRSSFVLAYLMWFVPPLRTLKGCQVVYYTCTNKK